MKKPFEVVLRITLDHATSDRELYVVADNEDAASRKAKKFVKRWRGFKAAKLIGIYKPDPFKNYTWEVR